MKGDTRSAAACSASSHELAPRKDYYLRNSPSAHDSPRPQRPDLGRSEPEFSQNLLRMFAKARRGVRGGEGLAVQYDRQTDGGGGSVTRAGRRQIEPQLSRNDLRVREGFADRVDRPGRHVRGHERGEQPRALPPFDRRLEHGDEGPAVAHAIFVRGVARIVGEFLQSENAAEVA